MIQLVQDLLWLMLALVVFTAIAGSIAGVLDK